MIADEFWNQQAFSYLVTYSFNRGSERQALIQQTEQALKNGRMMQQPSLQRQLYSLTQHSVTLTDGLSGFHVAAVPIAIVHSGSGCARQLAGIFQAATPAVWHSGCLPFYRDALAFYNDQGRLVRVLNICFECLTMVTDAGVDVEADAATYQDLRSYLVEAGHPIAE